MQSYGLKCVGDYGNERSTAVTRLHTPDDVFDQQGQGKKVHTNHKHPLGFLPSLCRPFGDILPSAAVAAAGRYYRGTLNIYTHIVIRGILNTSL